MQHLSLQQQGQESPMKGILQEGEVHIEGSLQHSADSEARWINKGKVSTYGYKGFVIVGGEDGAIHRTHMTPANTSECPEWEYLKE